MILVYILALVGWILILLFATYITTRKRNQCDATVDLNPNIVWVQYMDYLSTKSKIMKKEYEKRVTSNQIFSWDDVHNMDRNIRHKLNLIITQGFSSVDKIIIKNNRK